MHCIAHESLHLILFDWIHAKPQSAKITAGYELREIAKESVRLQRLDNKVWGMNSCTKIKLHAACSLFWVAVIVCALVSTHRFCGIDCIFLFWMIIVELILQIKSFAIYGYAAAYYKKCNFTLRTTFAAFLNGAIVWSLRFWFMWLQIGSFTKRIKEILNKHSIR